MKTTTRFALGTAALWVTLAGTGCLGGAPRRPVDRPSEVPTETAVLSGDTKPAMEEKRLAEFGVEVYWDSHIRGERLTRLQLEGNSLYAITESNRIYQVDMHSGKVNWVYDAGDPIQFQDRERPIAEWAYPKTQDGLPRYDEVYFCAKDTLHALDKKAGSELWRLRLSFGAGAPPQPSTTHVLVGSWDDWVYAIKKSNNPITWDWKVSTSGDIVARPAVDSPFGFVASTDGLLYTIDVARNELVGTFKTDRPISADPLVHRKLVYVASEDMDLYVLSTDGRLEHRFHAGAPMRKRPVGVGEREIYAATERAPGDVPEKPQHGVACLYKQDYDSSIKRTPFEHRWTRLKAERFLARGRESSYLLEPDDRGASITRKLVKVDSKDGFFRDELKLDGAVHYVTNPFDPNLKRGSQDNLLGGMILVGYSNGWIVALRERSEF